jgi:uncharacterized membrane protein
MKSKISFWLIFLGLIAGAGYSVWIIYGLIKSQRILSDVSYANPEVFSNLELYTQVGVVSSWISVILGIVLLIFIAINLLKKKPSKRNFKFIIILSAIGLITSIFYGAILMLIGGIVGYNSKNLH